MASSTDNKEDELAGTEQPFVQHLMELRNRLMYCVAGLLVVGLALAYWPGPSLLIDWIAQPIRAHMPPDSKLIAVGVLTPFLIPLKVLVMTAVLVSMPWLMYQVWAFVAPGLYQHEKRFALPLIFLGSLLAYVGIAFVQFFVLDGMFKFIQGFAPESVAATPDVASYVGVILSLYIAFALAFQVPIVVLLLVRFSLVTVEQLRSFRGYFWVLSFVIAAIVTPPDVLSQVSLAIPMGILYEVGIFASRWFAGSARTTDEDEEGATNQ